MEKTKKFAKKLLCISIALMLLSMIVSFAVQTDGGKVQIKELRIPTDAGYVMCANLYIPENATLDTPAPAVLCSHGAFNNKEMQDSYFVELSRRGYVVLAIDQPDHGNSDSVVGTGMDIIYSGVYQGVLALSRMPFVDTERIGITGHSAGGRSCNFAVGEDNANGTDLIAAVLLNCRTADYVDENGDYTNGIYGSRDVGIISAQYDEFWPFIYDGKIETVIKSGDPEPDYFSPHYMETNDAQSFLYFGIDPTGLEARSADTMYHQDVDGKDTVRVIWRPDIIHPWSHFSARSAAYTIEFFDETLGAPNPIPSDDQVWQWKEAFNAVGLVGMALFIVSFIWMMVYTPYFGELRTESPAAPAKVMGSKGKLWFWGCLIAGAIFASIIYLPVVAYGYGRKVAQPESMALALWSMLCGLFTILTMFIYYKCYGAKHGMDLEAVGIKMPLRKLCKTVLLAIITVALAYTWVFFADYFFKSDFRLWTLAAKAFDAKYLGEVAFPYMWMFILFYVPASVAANSFNYNTIGGKRGVGNSLIVAVFTAFPALVLPWMQYAYYYSTGRMLFYKTGEAYPCFILWLFPIVLILMAATFISRAVYKRTRNPYLAGIINAIIVAILTCVNTTTFIY